MDLVIVGECIQHPAILGQAQLSSKQIWFIELLLYTRSYVSLFIYSILLTVWAQCSSYRAHAALE